MDDGSLDGDEHSEFEEEDTTSVILDLIVHDRKTGAIGRKNALLQEENHRSAPTLVYTMDSFSEEEKNDERLHMYSSMSQIDFRDNDNWNASLATVLVELTESEMDNDSVLFESSVSSEGYGGRSDIQDILEPPKILSIP